MTTVGGIAADRLRSFVERIERLEEEIKALNADKADVYREAKGAGFCVKTLKKVIQRRRLTAMELDEADTMLELYERAINEEPSHAHAREAA